MADKGEIMAEIVKALGILFLVLGVVNYLKPNLVRSLIGFAKVGKRAYLGGIVRIALGIFLLFAIPHVGIPIIVGTIGVLALIAGLIILFIGMQRIHAFLDWLYALPDQKLRLFPLIGVLFGVLLIYGA